LGRENQSPQRLIPAEFGRFLIAGAVNTFATYVLYLLLLGSIGYLFAYSVAYVVGIVLSYWLNALFVFRAGAAVSTFVRYPLVYVVQYLLGAAVLWICVEWLGVPREIGLAFSIALTVPVTYLASKLALKGTLR
jgi:putative flippase GtrA